MTTPTLPSSPSRWKFWKAEPVEDPGIAQELEEIRIFHRLFIRLEEAYRAGRADNAHAVIEGIKRQLDLLILEREAKATVTTPERDQLEQQVRDYQEALRAGVPHPESLREDALRQIYRFVHRDPSMLILNTGHLLEQIDARNQIVLALRTQANRMEGNYQKTLLALAAVVVLSGITVAYTVTSKSSLRDRFKGLREENEQKDQRLAEQQAALADLQRQISSLPSQQRTSNLLQKIEELQAEKQVLATVMAAKQSEIASVESRVRTLEQQNQQLRQEIHALRPGPPITLADLQWAQELKQMARNGKPLTDDQIDLIRTVSEFMIHQWKDEAHAAIQGLQEHAEQAIRSGGSPMAIRNEMSANIIQVQQALDAKIVQEVNEIDALVVRARNARQ
ncbi:MAG: hypothetical protein AB7J40_03015 [Candidatus Altimarinota bacterium]